MKNSHSLRHAALVLGGLLSFAFGAVLAPAADQPVLRALADKAPALPVSSTFTKVEGEKGPYVLAVKNTGAHALKVHVAVVESVKSHAKPRDRKHEYTIEAGAAASIEELAAGDKVTVSAEGFEPLELTVP
jgi:hypothetical protein